MIGSNKKWERRFVFIFCTSVLISCGSTKRTSPVIGKGNAKTSKTIKRGSNNSTSGRIINYAKAYQGTRYKYGGVTKKGMDCSGLVYTAFQKEGIALPRTSLAMSKRGKRIKLHQVLKGDLLFFRTNKRKAAVNHVGLVTAVNRERILFIHATSSKGVLTSNLNESYWLKAFVEARRVL